jgi:hypothetical protein
VGLNHFFPAHVLLTVKPKELRKQVVTSQKELKKVPVRKRDVFALSTRSL